MNEGL
jgi:hypothetical protein